MSKNYKKPKLPNKECVFYNPLSKKWVVRIKFGHRIISASQHSTEQEANKKLTNKN